MIRRSLIVLTVEILETFECVVAGPIGPVALHSRARVKNGLDSRGIRGWVPWWVDRRIEGGKRAWVEGWLRGRMRRWDDGWIGL